MDAREHALISDLVAEHAHHRAVTAEDELVADWARETDRLRHERLHDAVRQGTRSA